MTNILIIIITGLLAVIVTLLVYIDFYRNRSAGIIFGLMGDITNINSLNGACQVTYNKTETTKVINYTFDFIGLDHLKEQLQRYKNPDQVALYFKDTKQFYDRH